MFNIRSILNLLALGSVMVDNPVPQRILSKTLYVIGLVIITSMMVVALLVSILAVIYQAMVSNGVIQIYAALYTLAIIFVITAGAGLATYLYVKQLLEVVGTSSKKPVPLTTHLSVKATDVVEAFFNGLFNRRTRPKQYYSDYS